MEVELQRTLSLEEERDCKTLLSLCNLEEEIPYDTDLDYDFFYLIRNEGEKETGIAEGILALLMGYKLGEQQGGKDVLLCLAFVHPKMRGQGLFTQCKESLMDDFRNCVFRFMKKGEREEEFSLSFPYLYTEYFLEKTLEEGIAYPGEKRVYPYGEVFFSPYNEKTLYLYGLMVENRFRGQGKGEEILRDCLDRGEAGVYQKVILQVDSRNSAAMRLYTKMGFQIKDLVSYYRGERKRNRDGKNI